MIKRVAIDLETQGLDPYTNKILLFVLCDDRGGEYYWKPHEEELPQFVLDMLVDPNIMVIIHNAAFDTKMIKHRWGVVVKNVWDTMRVDKLLLLGKKNLDFDLSSVLLRRYGIVLDKDEIKNFLQGVVTEKGIKMGLEDTRYLLTTQEDQENEVRKVDLMYNAVRIENNVAYAFGQIEYNGLPFNTPLYLQYVNKTKALFREANKTILGILNYPYVIDELTGDIISDLNLNSSKQLPAALRKKGIKLKNVDKKTLKGFLYKSKDNKNRLLIQSILVYKKLKTAIGKKYDTKLNPVTRRLHGSYNSLGTDTGRASASNPNGQQIQKDVMLLQPQDDGSYKAVSIGVNFRDPFEAPPGWVWISADYSQMELRAYAGVAGVLSILMEYKKDEPDLHRLTASMLFHKSPIDVSDYERMLGKIFNFAIITYGGGPNAVIQAALDFGILLTWSEAEVLIKTSVKADPEGQAWGKEMVAQALEDGYLINLAGYRRFLSKSMCRETICKNTPIQGLCGAILKEAMITFQDWIDTVAGCENVQLIAQVHDELNALAKKEWADRTLEAIEYCMVVAGNKYLEDLGVKCTVDAHIYDRWQK